MSPSLIRSMLSQRGYVHALLAFLFCASASGTCLAGPLSVGGSLTYNPATQSGFDQGSTFDNPGWGVNNNGTAAGYAFKILSNVSKGSRAMRWDITGSPATELGNLGTDSSGTADAGAYGINDVGTAVGFARKYVSGSNVGDRAVRWSAGGTVPTELGNLGTKSGTGVAFTYAYAINSAGTAAGSAELYDLGTYRGVRAVRWDASGTAATQLGSLGLLNTVFTEAEAFVINDSGVIAGWSDQYVSNAFKGKRPVRWDASSTTATELGVLGTDSTGSGEGHPSAINSAGTITGYSRKYVAGSDMGRRAVRWNASGTAATELGNLGTASNGSTDELTYAINTAGTVVGFAEKYVSGVDLGQRAVRWNSSGTAATELANLGTDASGTTYAIAYGVNDAGTAVGYAQKFTGGALVGSRAVAWLPDASVIDLNDLNVVPVPAGGSWTLTGVNTMSADGYVVGTGIFDPDGAGPLASYNRAWVGQIGLGGNWLNTTNANNTWGKGANWSTGTPAIQLDAAFNQPVTYTVDFSRDEQARNAAFSNGTVTLTLSNHLLTVANSLSVASPATLKGGGAILGNVTNSGKIDPSDASGILPGTYNLTGNLSTTGILQFDLASISNFDQINLSGQFNAGGTIRIQLSGGYHPTAGSIFDVMDFGSFVNSGYAFDFTNAALGPGLTWNTTSFATTGEISVAAVPEPSTLILVGIGLLGLLAIARKR